jgi:hypothetical protein
MGPWGGNFYKVEPGTLVWGSALGPTHADLPTATFPGLVLLLLGTLGAVYGLRKGGRLRAAAVAGAALTFVGAIIAVGTASTGWRKYAPYRLLFELGPPFNALRGTARAWMIGTCGLGLLGGIGAVALVRWLQRHATVARRPLGAVIAVALVVLVILEGLDPWYHDPRVTVPAVDRELARLSTSGGVVYLPMMPNNPKNLSVFTQPTNLYGDTAHHRRTLNGFSGYTPPSYAQQSRALYSLPSPSAVALLRRLGMRFVVVHSEVAGTPWQSLRSPSAAAPLKYLGTYGGDELYEVPDP